jgi:hypothetical protein
MLPKFSGLTLKVEIACFIVRPQFEFITLMNLKCHMSLLCLQVGMYRGDEDAGRISSANVGDDADDDLLVETVL